MSKKVIVFSSTRDRSALWFSVSEAYKKKPSGFMLTGVGSYIYFKHYERGHVTTTPVVLEFQANARHAILTSSLRREIEVR